MFYRGNPGLQHGWYPPYQLWDTEPVEEIDLGYGENDFQLFNIEEVKNDT